jgi:hypothetical protein
LLDDLRALVEFAQAGSVAGAADRLYRTPSAITRQLQRLEAALGAELQYIFSRAPSDLETSRPGFKPSRIGGLDMPVADGTIRMHTHPLAHAI